MLSCARLQDYLLTVKQKLQAQQDAAMAAVQAECKAQLDTMQVKLHTPVLQ